MSQDNSNNRVRSKKFPALSKESSIISRAAEIYVSTCPWLEEVLSEAPSSTEETAFFWESR